MCVRVQACIHAHRCVRVSATCVWPLVRARAACGRLRAACSALTHHGPTRPRAHQPRCTQEQQQQDRRHHQFMRGAFSTHRRRRASLLPLLPAAARLAAGCCCSVGAPYCCVLPAAAGTRTCRTWTSLRTTTGWSRRAGLAWRACPRGARPCTSPRAPARGRSPTTTGAGQQCATRVAKGTYLVTLLGVFSDDDMWARG